MPSRQDPQSQQGYTLVKLLGHGNLDAAKQIFLRSFHHQYKKYDPVMDLGLKPLKPLKVEPSLETNADNNNEDNDNDNHRILEAFLQMAFAEEIGRFVKIHNEGQPSNGQCIEYFFQVEESKKGTRSSVSLAKDDNRDNTEKAAEVVGYASIQYEPSKNHCYIHQLGVCPKHWGRGIGRKLVFALVEGGWHPDLASISVLTRRINQEGIDFYKHIGFEEVSFQAKQDDYLDFTKYIQLEWKK